MYLNPTTLIEPTCISITGLDNAMHTDNIQFTNNDLYCKTSFLMFNIGVGKEILIKDNNVTWNVVYDLNNPDYGSGISSTINHTIKDAKFENNNFNVISDSNAKISNFTYLRFSNFINNVIELNVPTTNIFSFSTYLEGNNVVANQNVSNIFTDVDNSKNNTVLVKGYLNQAIYYYIAYRSADNTRIANKNVTHKHNKITIETSKGTGDNQIVMLHNVGGFLGFGSHEVIIDHNTINNITATEGVSRRLWNSIPSETKFRFIGNTITGFNASSYTAPGGTSTIVVE